MKRRRRSKNLRVRLPEDILQAYRRLWSAEETRQILLAQIRQVCRADPGDVRRQAVALAARPVRGPRVACFLWLPRRLADDLRQAEAENYIGRSLLLTLAVLETARELGLHSICAPGLPVEAPDDRPEVLLSLSI